MGPPRVIGSWTDGDQVFDARDAGHLPGDPLSLLALCPGSNGAAQRHGAAIGFDGYAIGIELGAATKGLFDLASTSTGGTRGLTWMRLVTPLTPRTRRTARSARSFA